MTAVIARIILRYVSAALVTYGIVSSELGNAFGNDADVVLAVEVMLGMLVGLTTEGWYYVAKRDGGAT
jgi:hypothetical protein